MSPGVYSRAVLNGKKRPQAPALRPVKTEVRGGVLHIIGRGGRSLGPVASPHIAQTYGAALQRAGIF